MSAAQQLPAVSRPQERLIVHDPVGVLDTARFEHLMRIAKVMACSSLIPDSLTTKGTKENKKALEPDQILGNCFLVVNQAARWNADPFAVAQCVSVVRGKICYEGKLIAAIIAAKLGVRLRFDWNDKPGDNFGIVVSGVIPGEDEIRAIEGTVGQWRTDNEAWKKNPRNMLAYRGSREWGRLHAADIMLGVYSPDELEDLTDNMKATRAKDVTRKEPPSVPQDDKSYIAPVNGGPGRGTPPEPEPESFQDELAQLEKRHAAEDAAKAAQQPEDKADDADFAPALDAKERAATFAKMRAEENARVDAALAKQKAQKTTTTDEDAARIAEAAQRKAKREVARREAEEEAALRAVEESQRAIAAEEEAAAKRAHEGFADYAEEQREAAKRTPPDPSAIGLELTDELMDELQAKARERETYNPELAALIEEGTAHAQNGRKAPDGLDRWYNGLCVKDLDLINPHMRQLIAVAKKADARPL